MTSGFQAVTTINTNFDDIETEFQDSVLYRNNPAGEPNEMNCDLDMNGYDILNIGNLSALVSASYSQAVLFGTARDGTGTHSLSVGDAYRYIEFSASSSVTAVAFLTPISTAGWANGTWIGLAQIGVGQIKVVADTGVTLRYRGAPRTAGQYSTARLIHKGADVWYLEGDISAS